VRRKATPRLTAGVHHPSTMGPGLRKLQIMVVLVVVVQWAASAAALAQVAVAGACLLLLDRRRGWTQRVSVLSPFVRVAGLEALAVVIVVSVGACPSDRIGVEIDGGFVAAAAEVGVVAVVEAAAAAAADED